MRLSKLPLILLMASAAAFGQQQTINVGTGPNSGNGDNLRTGGTKINANFAQWFTLNGIIKGTNGGAPTVATSSDVVGLFSGCSGVLLLGADGGCHSGGGNPPFNAVTSGSNTSAAMTVGTGASLGTTGSGTISATTATALAATPTQCSGTVSTGVTAAGNCNGTSTPTLGASGTLGSLTLGNATSGTVTILPPTGALGTLNITLPNVSGTLLYSGGPGGTPSAINLSNATNLPCGALPAFTGDVSNSGCGFTVSKVNGAIPTPSALVAATNSSSQIVAESQANNTVLCNVSGGSATAAACTPAQTIQAINSATANAQTGTSYTPGLSDGNGTVTMSNASANTYCVPPNSSVAYPVGTLLTVQEVSTGVTSLAPAGASGCAGSGVTITSAAYGSSTSQTYSMGGVYGFIQIQQTSTNTWNVVDWKTPVGLQLGALSIGSEMQAYLAASTTFTESGTGCTPSAHSGGPFVGKITLAATCTAVVVTLNGATGFTDSNGFGCWMADDTLQAAGTWFGTWVPSSQTGNVITFPVPGAAGATDTVEFYCHPRSIP